MNIGITLVFREKNNTLISGVLKSLVFQTEIYNFKNEVNELGYKIAKHYNYTFLGINDVFTVTGDVKQGEILGRTTYYEFNNIKKANTLKNDLFKKIVDTQNQIKKFKISLIYFCENNIKEKFTITVLTILESQSEKIEININDLSENLVFKNKIINMSLDSLIKLDFIGLESLEEIDLEFNVFENLYSDFENLKQLKEEIIPQRELNKELKDIFLHHQ